MHTLRTIVHCSINETSKFNDIEKPALPEEGRFSPFSDGYLLPNFEAFLLDSNALDRSKNGHLLPDGHLARRKALPAGFYWDRELPGLALRVYGTGRRRWIVQFRHRGATRRITLGNLADLSATDAREAAREVLATNALDGLPQRPPRKTRSDPRFADFVAEFWRDYSGHWKPSTQKRNRQAIDRRLVPWFGRRHVGTITRADILSWRETMRDRQGLFNRDLPVLAAMLGYAGKLGYLPGHTNPCKGIERYRRKLPERYLTAKEYCRLARVLAAGAQEWPEVADAIWLLIYTGARKSEITGLHREWIDPPFVHLPDSKTGPKRLYLNTQALAILAARRGEGQGPVFPDLLRRAHVLPKAWDQIRRRAAIPDVRLHDLRHSFASVAIMDGMSLARIGKLLGHALPETTARYAHLADTVIADAASRVSGSIAAALGLRS